jgi:hypothetical protein
LRRRWAEQRPAQHRRLDVLEYLDIAAAIGFDPREPLGALLKE